MSARANSLQSVAVDTLYFALLTGLTAIAVTASAQGAEPRSEQIAELARDRRLTDDHSDGQTNTDDNEPSGDQSPTPADDRETIILGMKLVELGVGNIRVVDVTATSPAWDAGIRRGDRLLSIDSLKPRALERWVKDVARVLAEAHDGEAVPAEINRDGNTLAVRIRLPISRAAEVRDARQEERALANMAAGNSGQMQQGPAATQDVPMQSNAYDSAYAGRGGYGVAGWGIGGDFFDDQSSARNGDDRMANSAIARLMAVNTVANSAMTGTTSQTAATGGGQVGLAAFQNTGQGVRAMVVVRGLPQGTYRVGIGQGGLASGLGGDGFDNSSNGSNNRFDNGQNATNFQNGNLQDANRQRNLNHNQLRTNPNRFDQRRRSVQPAVPNGNGGNRTVPAGTARPGTGASLANPEHAFLAQQLDSQQLGQTQNTNPNGFGSQTQSNATGNTTQNTTGQNPLQSDRPPIAPSDNSIVPNGPTGNAAQNSTGQNPVQSDRPPIAPSDNSIVPSGNSANSVPFVTEIGTLRVGSDGSGRVENQFEGMQVRNLSGMSVTVISQISAATRNANPVNTSTNPRAPGFTAGQASAANSPGVVATGVIQLMEGSAPNLGGNQTTNGQQPVDEATRQQRARSQISTPRNFDPSQPSHLSPSSQQR